MEGGWAGCRLESRKMSARADIGAVFLGDVRSGCDGFLGETPLRRLDEAFFPFFYFFHRALAVSELSLLFVSFSFSIFYCLSFFSFFSFIRF